MTVQMKSERAVRQITSRLPGVRASVTAHANRFAATARANLARHRYEGNARIEVLETFNARYGRLDALVCLVDLPHQRPDGSWSRGNAMSIEFGHIHNRSGKYVEGLYILTSAYRTHTGL
jgi:hypothetical protein